MSGLLVVLLGVWAGLIPFVGPYFDFGFSPDEAWHYSSSRFWLSILPGAVAVIGGLMMILASRRHSGTVGGWLAVAAGAWLIVGPSLSLLWQDEAGIGDPLGGTDRQAIEWVACFYGVGALIVGLAAFATGRFLSRPHVAEEAAEVAAERGEEPRPAPVAAERREEPRPAPAATPPARERAAATEREPVAEEAPPAGSAPTPEKVDNRPPTEKTAMEPTRVRRRQGGLVGRFLRRRGEGSARR
jgi:MFS family permease